jgi:hypothetical protein
MVFASLASFAFASISVSGDNIIYHGVNKGNIFFDVVYGASVIYFDDGMLMLHNLNGYYGIIGFSCDTSTANMTITKIASDELDYTVNAPTDVTSTTKIYVGSKGRPSDVSGATSWAYNSNLKIVTVNILHYSPSNIVLEWSNTIQDHGVTKSILGAFAVTGTVLLVMSISLVMAALNGSVDAQIVVDIIKVAIIVGLFIGIFVYII